MPLAFLDPGLLWLASAGAIPVVAHLVARTRPPESRLPTLEFLQRASKRVWRMRRPRDLLMLLLRTLALLALATAFARPLWTSGSDWGGAGTDKHLVVVVDRSASMAARSRGQSHFSLAKARALEAVRGAGRLASANLVWIGTPPEAAFPGMARTSEPIEAALRDAEATGEAGSAEAAMRLALERLEGVEGRKEIVVVSDFQAGSWSERPPELPSDVRVLYLPVGEASENLSLADLAVDPPWPFPGERVTVAARVANHSAERRSARIALTIGTRRQVETVEVEPWGEGQLFFEDEIPGEGAEVLVAASIEGAEDGLAGDDRRWSVVRQRERLRAATAFAADGVSEGEAAIWSRVLASLPWVEQSDDAETADLVLAAGGRPDEAVVSALLARGGGLFLLPAPGAPLPPGWPVPLAAAVRETAEPDAEGWRLRLGSEGDPLFRLFASGEYGDPVSGTVRERLRTDPYESGEAAWEEWDLAMRYEDGVPAVLRSRSGGGTVWWWNLPLDPELSTWTQQPAFLPVLGEAFLQSAPSAAADPHVSAEPGRGARWEPARFPDGGEIVLLDDEGGVVATEEDGLSGALAYRTAGSLQPGVYRWALRDAELERDVVLALTVVNFPVSEMDPRAVDPAAWEAAAATGSAPSRRPDWAALRDGLPLWPWFVAAALALLACEGLYPYLAALRRPAGGNAPSS